MTKMKRHRLGQVAILSISLLLSGCTTPEAVQKFTTLAADASAKVPIVFRDLSASCVRKELADRPAEEIEDIREKIATTTCKLSTEDETRLLGALSVLTGYMNALNQLASNDVVSYDTQIDSFASSVQSAGNFNDSQVTAVKGLAKFLADAAASGYQRKKLVSSIKSADKDVATLCKFLGDTIGIDYVRELNVEQESVRDRYKNAILADSPGNRGPNVLIQDRWRNDLQKFADRKRAAADAQNLLKEISDGHHVLAAQADHWSAKELYKDLGPYSASIQTLISDFQTAF